MNTYSKSTFHFLPGRLGSQSMTGTEHSAEPALTLPSRAAPLAETEPPEGVERC